MCAISQTILLKIFVCQTCLVQNEGYSSPLKLTLAQKLFGQSHQKLQAAAARIFVIAKKEKNYARLHNMVGQHAEVFKWHVLLACFGCALHTVHVMHSFRLDFLDLYVITRVLQLHDHSISFLYFYW